MLNIFACGSALTPSMVRGTTDRIINAGHVIDTVHIPPAQLCAWEMIGLSCVQVITKEGVEVKDVKEFFKDMLRTKPNTMAGFPIVEDVSLLPSVIEFRSADGILARIEQLEIPVMYAPDSVKESAS